MIETLRKFAKATGDAAQFRRELKARFGLTDYQIETMAQPPDAPNPLQSFAMAAYRAKRRLEKRKTQ